MIEIGFDVARIYGELLHYLRQQGTPIPVNDIWIAAACVEHGCILLTRDRHFDKLPQVRVRYPEGWMRSIDLWLGDFWASFGDIERDRQWRGPFHGGRRRLGLESAAEAGRWARLPQS